MAGLSGGIAAAAGLAGAVSGASGGGGGGMPRWQRKAQKANMAEANKVAAGMRVAGFNPDQRAAQQGVRDYQGYLDSDMRGAQATAADLAGGINASDISQFYNPYEDDVIGAYMNDLGAMRDREDLRVNDAAEAAGAFGGDREAVYRAVSQGEMDRTGATTLAGIRSSGYDMASRNVLQNQGLRLSGNDQLAQLIEARQFARARELGALGSSGAVQQNQRQSVLDLPQRRLGVLLDAAGQRTAPTPPSYDPIGGALHGFEGGYQTGADIAGLLSRIHGYTGPGGPGAAAYERER